MKMTLNWTTEINIRSSGSLNSSPYISSEENEEKSLVVDVREKTESVAWVIQMPPSPNETNYDKRRKRN